MEKFDFWFKDISLGFYRKTEDIGDVVVVKDRIYIFPAKKSRSSRRSSKSASALLKDIQKKIMKIAAQILKKPELYVEKTDKEQEIDTEDMEEKRQRMVRIRKRLQAYDGLNIGMKFVPGAIMFELNKLETCLLHMERRILELGSPQGRRYFHLQQGHEEEQFIAFLNDTVSHFRME